MRILIISILLLIGISASAQIQPYQVRGNTPKSILWVLGTDTIPSSGKYGLGKWYNADSLDLGCHAIESFYLEEDGSLSLVNCTGDTLTFTAGGDTDWYKLNTTAIPNNTDSMERDGYMLLNGLNGGLPTKIEMLKEGYLRFQNDGLFSQTRYLLNAPPLQSGEGGADLGITHLSVPNAFGDRNNETTSYGFNPISQEDGITLNIESHFQPADGEAYWEIHVPVYDLTGLAHRALSGTFNKDLSDWNWYATADAFSWKHVADNELYARLTWDHGESTSLRLNGTDTGEGIQFNLETSINALILNGIDGLGANSIFWSNLDGTMANRMRVINDWGTFNGSTGTAVDIWGAQVDGEMQRIAAGWGIDLLDNELSIDMEAVADSIDVAGDGNGIFDAANEGATTAIIAAKVPDDGFYFEDLDGTGFFGYEPGTGGVNIVDFDDRPSILVTNLGAYEARIGIDNEVTIGTNVAGDFLITDLGSSIIPFKIENATTVNNTVKIEADGDVMIADYPNSRDDAGAPTNILATDGTGVIQSHPVAETVQDIAGAMYSGNTETGITITYDDSDGTIDAVATDASATNELQTLTIDSSGASAPRTITIGITPSGNEVTFLDLSGGGGGGSMDDWLLAASGTGGTETISDGETVTITAGTGITATRSTNNVTIASTVVDTDTDEQDITANGAGPTSYTIDVSGSATAVTLSEGTGINLTRSTNTITVASTVTDTDTDDQNLTLTGTSGTITTAIDGGTDVQTTEGVAIDITAASNVMTIDVDGGEFTTVTTPEADDYLLMWDDDGPEQKILYSDVYDLITAAGGNSIYVGDGTVPSDVDAAVTDSLEFGPGIVKIVNASNDAVGIGAETPSATLHVRSTTTGVYPETILEALGETVELQTKSVSGASQPPFKLTVQNKDTDIDISGDYYKMGEMSFNKAATSTPGGNITFSVGYDSLNMENILVLNSRESGATDGYTSIAGGLRYKWTTNSTTAVTLNTGYYGLTTTNAGTKTVTLPDATSAIVGQFFMVFNSGAGVGTIAITGGSGDTIYGTPTLNQNESVQVHCPAADKWVITN